MITLTNEWNQLHTWINDEDGLCPLCDLMDIENESHFMFYCPLCDELKEVPRTIIASISANFSSMDDNERVQRGFCGLNLECLGNYGNVLDSADVKICECITTTFSFGTNIKPKIKNQYISSQL